jgi:hypothetical protein
MKGGDFLHATVRGDRHADYEGGAFFEVGDGPSAGQPATFTVGSRGSGSNVGKELLIVRVNGGVPTAGRYDLTLPLEEGKAGPSITALYSETGAVYEGFVAQSGELHMTAVRTGRIEGNFTFIGARYCLVGRDRGTKANDACIPSRIPHGAPRITVSGSFAATPRRGEPLLP